MRRADGKTATREAPRRAHRANGRARAGGQADRVARIARTVAALLRIEALRWRLAARDAAWRAMMMAWLGLALCAATVAAAACVVLGAAGGIAEAFGGRTWAGLLVAGLAFFAVVYLAASGQRRRQARERAAELLADLDGTAPPRAGANQDGDDAAL
jgi:hypothetical protein